MLLTITIGLRERERERVEACSGNDPLRYEKGDDSDEWFDEGPLANAPLAAN